ncbi:MAG: beta-galactosidase [Deltaproteobacteria bacterium]
MKKKLFALGFFFVLVGVCKADFTIDISGSQYETKSTDTVRIRNVVVPGFSDKYWVDFQWNPSTFVLMPINGGVESNVLPSKRLPKGFVGIFLPLTPMDAAYTERQVKTAKSCGIEAVALVVHWKDVEPSENQYNFNQLNNLIDIVKSNGMYAVIRIYFNGGPMDEASPSWLFTNLISGVDYYSILSQRDHISMLRQPLPWSNAYLVKIDKLLKDMTQFFATQATALPDEIQLSVGGDYGEQWLNAPDIMQPMGYKIFVGKLLNAAKLHVEMFQKYFPHIETTLMAGSLLEENDPMNGELIGYSLSHGVKWVQTNANVSKLQACTWGPTTMAMFAPHITNGTMYFAIEEEGGADGVWADGKCPYIGPEDVATRLSRIIKLESDYGFRFQGVYLKGYADGSQDMSDANKQGISDLVKHVKNQ